MRARLDRMAIGQEFRFLCIKKMADKMEQIVATGGGEILDSEVRPSGVVITIRKKEHP